MLQHFTGVLFFSYDKRQNTNVHKYCDPCQMQNMHKLEKCPHILQSIPAPQKCFGQIGLDLIGPSCESNKKHTLYHALIISLNVLLPIS